MRKSNKTGASRVIATTEQNRTKHNKTQQEQLLGATSLLSSSLHFYYYYYCYYYHSYCSLLFIWRMFFVKSCQSSEWLFFTFLPLACSQFNSSFSLVCFLLSLIVSVPRLHMCFVSLYVSERCLFRLQTQAELDNLLVEVESTLTESKLGHGFT